MKAGQFVVQLRELLAEYDHWPLLIASDSDLQDGFDRPRFPILRLAVDEVEREICLFVLRAITPRHEPPPPPPPITLGEFVDHISPLAAENERFDIVASIDAPTRRSSRRSRRYDLPVAS